MIDAVRKTKNGITPSRKAVWQVLEDAVKVIYDKETDTLSIILRPGKVAESEEPRPGLILDYDKGGRLVSIELLDASVQVKGPQSVEFALAASD